MTPALASQKPLSPERKARRRARRRAQKVRAQGILHGVAAMLTPRDVVLDCGANVGLITQTLAQTGAQVHAFEPDTAAFEELSARMVSASNVTLYNAAVGTKAGRAPLHRAAGFAADPIRLSTRSSLLQTGEDMEKLPSKQDVEVVDLPAFLRQLCHRYGDVALLKLDVEGSELELLESLHSQELLAQIRLTVAETHEGKFRHLRPRYRALRKDLADCYPPTKVYLEWT
ncbi:MAG: FkbM family methyltransferase [Sedimentitalea sp.]